MTPVEVTQGDGPIILSLPHTGTFVPDAILARLNARGRELADTDWHVDRLYAGLLPGATTVRATFHRYVIDANRAPADESLYPGQNTTGLVPTTDFDGAPIWTTPPDAAEVADRLNRFHAPYHAALAAQIDRVKARHGFAVLYDCHSIRSRIPFLFDGTLPDFNIGTNSGQSCAAALEAAVADLCAAAPGYSCVSNGRFKGGWTTRHYGRPAAKVHALQMELAQSTYMHERAPWTYLPDSADRLRGHLSKILETLSAWRPA